MPTTLIISINPNINMAPRKRQCRRSAPSISTEDFSDAQPSISDYTTPAVASLPILIVEGAQYLPPADYNNVISTRRSHIWNRNYGLLVINENDYQKQRWRCILCSTKKRLHNVSFESSSTRGIINHLRVKHQVYPPADDE